MVERLTRLFCGLFRTTRAAVAEFVVMFTGEFEVGNFLISLKLLNI